MPKMRDQLGLRCLIAAQFICDTGRQNRSRAVFPDLSPQTSLLLLAQLQHTKEGTALAR